MKGQSAQSSRSLESFPRPLDAVVAALRAARKTLLAHVSEAFTRESHVTDDIVGMSAHMLRDIGAQAYDARPAAGRPDLQHPRL
jgi:hypothetical protein